MRHALKAKVMPAAAIVDTAANNTKCWRNLEIKGEPAVAIRAIDLGDAMRETAKVATVIPDGDVRRLLIANARFAGL
ncbi:unnamed protein product [Fusarium graminearum]|uniref:Chromosome 2, complete genome n=1 Tax=Gibberella zeae (strain ATCC MYA-4620 / CBS 123657 / FGSC 9075 / NRRL 31084 / PH-1) TaxID=229533 RepID=A0A0E0S695_GIBZE|nr:hypothetical protein FG05_30103 [Fusarium graminearum]CEF79020.1 unnamed protein product [Fusarium graminearum]CZS82308.1 unnamed protein product [Fusarium graminearum]